METEHTQQFNIDPEKTARLSNLDVLRAYQRQMYYSRMHNLYAYAFSQYGAQIDPSLEIVVDHIYEKETKRETFENLDLELGLRQSLYDGVLWAALGEVQFVMM